MAKPNPHRPFTPDPDQIALRPKISGNTINGLGEAAFRNPNPVYWATDTETIAHGDMQNWFFTVDPQEPGFAVARQDRQAMIAEPLSAIAPTQTHRAPADWTSELHSFVKSGDCEKVGVAKMNPDWVYADQVVQETRIVMVGVQHTYSNIAKAPEPAAGLEVMAQYNRAIGAALTITNWLRGQGWEATPVTGPMTGALTLIPPALACGFGELGKHGSIIDKDMGASFRLSAVLTNAPFEPTPAQQHGIDGFCQNCRICEDACPPNALFPDKKTVRGQEKWYVDFDACLPFFNQHQGCAICIAVCPWSRPGVGPNLAAKLSRRSARKGA